MYKIFVKTPKTTFFLKKKNSVTFYKKGGGMGKQDLSARNLEFTRDSNKITQYSVLIFLKQIIYLFVDIAIMLERVDISEVIWFLKFITKQINI